MPSKSKFNENTMKIIDASDVPVGRLRVGKWEAIFNNIPSGKALVVTEDEVSFSGLRSSLYGLQRKGKFKNLQAKKIKEPDGTSKMYVINNV